MVLFLGRDYCMTKALQLCIKEWVDFYFFKFLNIFIFNTKNITLNSTQVISAWNLKLDYPPPISPIIIETLEVPLGPHIYP